MCSRSEFNINSHSEEAELSMIGYEIEYFSFLIIAVLFSAGNAKKNVFTVFIDPIVTIDVLGDEDAELQSEYANTEA